MCDVDGFSHTIQQAGSDTWFRIPIAIFMSRMESIKRALVYLNKAHGNVHSNVHMARNNLGIIQDQLTFFATRELLLKKNCFS